MRETLILITLIFSSIHAFEPEVFDKFLGDLIDTWNLHSPTIIVQGDLPELCIKRPWMLCLSDGLDTTELVNLMPLWKRTE